MTVVETTLGRFSDRLARSEMGRAQQRAAEAYGSSNAAFQVHGSTGANAVAVRAHKRHAGRLNVLVARGCHHSIVNEVLEIGGMVRFLHGAVDRRFEEPLPPRPDQLHEALLKAPDTDVVVITSPTYAGFNAAVEELAAVAHAHDVLLHVDSAWGALLGFHPTLPSSPAALGADTCAISVHKVAGAHSGGALLTWSDRMDPDSMSAASVSYVTTSPSYVIAASVDHSIARLAAEGEPMIERAATLRDELARRLLRALAAVEVLGDAPVSNAWAHLDTTHRIDPTRLTVGLAGYRKTGFAVAADLARDGIVVEKAGVETVTMLIALGAPDNLPSRTSTAFARSLQGSERDVEQPRSFLLPDPLRGLATEAVIPRDAAMMLRREGEAVSLEAAAGRVSLELVEAYPPGIPIGVPGFRLSAAAVEYLIAVREAGGHLSMLDPTGHHIQVLKEA